MQKKGTLALKKNPKTVTTEKPEGEKTVGAMDVTWAGCSALPLNFKSVTNEKFSPSEPQKSD